MQYILRHFQQAWRSKFARNVAIVASGTAAAQVITVAFSPIITRLYGPEAFGVLGTFNAVLAIMVPLAALSYPIAIVLPKEDNDARGLVKLSIGLGVVTSSVVLLLLALFKEPFLNVLSLDSIGNLIFLVPVAMFLSVLTAVSKNWVIRKRLFNFKAKVAVLNSLISNIAKSGVGLVAPLASALVSIATVVQGLSALLVYLRLKRNKGREFRKVELAKHDPSYLKELAGRHIDFAYFRMPREVINAIFQGLPVVILATMFGSTVVGFYVLTLTVMKLPSKLIGSSVKSVLYPKISQVILNGRRADLLILKSCLGLASVSFIPYIIVIIWGPHLFAAIFGSDWVAAGEVARWVAIRSFFELLKKPTMAAVPALGLQKCLLLIEVVTLLVTTLIMVGMYQVTSSYIYVIASYSLCSALIATCFMIFVFLKSKQKS